MDITFLRKERKSGRVAFLLKGANAAFANTLRRCIINDVQTLAIEHVEIRKNSSILYDEIIAHRLGLLPLKTDLESYVPVAGCTCAGAGCAKCSAVFTLKAKGPCIVYASQLESSDPRVVPTYQDTPITKLLKGQELELEAKAVLGQGKEHAKWSPALAYYKYKPIVEITKQPKNPDEVAKRCPSRVFDVKGGKLVINKENLMECILCGECAELTQSDVKIDESEQEIIFFIEPFGQLSVTDIITAAVRQLGARFEAFAQTIEEKA